MAKTPKDKTVVAPDGQGAPKPYVVLARKYRPRTFDDMIGQEALVTTLRNAFKTGRIAQAYMLTGVRGVGKTTTARILARALNYEHDGVVGPTVDMPEFGRHCAEIIESRHPDIIEMDAASNTGIDDVREIIENARYKPLVARYKVFIIDEVHMLSKNAFNALLKTLEEPPEHVKFIFATTEIRKVPVTVLSRCQRFDLRRVDVLALAQHFERIITSEGAKAEPEALGLIARAAEGSVRDGLSILDQAIAMGSGAVTADDVRGMLGLANRGRILDLVEHVLGGRAKDAVEALAALHKDGAEARQALTDLSEAVHVITRVKIAGAGAVSDEMGPDDKRRTIELSATLSIAILSRAWQMLLKGIEEVAAAGNPVAAAEMVLIRLAYTADLPTPDEIIKSLGGVGVSDRQRGGVTAPSGGSGETRSPLNEVSRPQPAAGAQAAAVRGQSLQVVGGKPKAPPPPWEEIGGEDEALAELARPQGSSSLTDEPPPAMSADDYGGFAESDVAGVEIDEDLAEVEAEIGPALAPIAQAAVVRSFDEVIELASVKRDAMLKLQLEDNVSLVKFDAAQGAIEIFLTPRAPKEIANHLREKLNLWTGRRWMVAVSPRMGATPVGQVMRERAAAELEELKLHPAVGEVFKAFPHAKIASVRAMPRAKKDDAANG
ncbi:MAG: DNA polymerase III subunit gamma/tau [Hyphomicrobiaceae bacterium]|nr:DNA polymerase III subunit gamma/tau [Hyphomicrobiaceae bacterium]